MHPKKGLIAIICYNKLEKEKGEMGAIEPVYACSTALGNERITQGDDDGYRYLEASLSQAHALPCENY